MQFLGITMHRGAERKNQIIPIQGTYAFNATRRVYLCKGILTSFTASFTASLWNISYPDKMGSMHDDLLNQHPMKHLLVLQFNMNGWENSNVRCPWLVSKHKKNKVTSEISLFLIFIITMSRYTLDIIAIEIHMCHHQFSSPKKAE